MAILINFYTQIIGFFQGAHSDWIFDITWLDDEFFVSGSRDTTVALWRVKDEAKEDNLGGEYSQDSTLPSFKSMKPLAVKVCKNAEKVRALLFNNNYQELVALSLNAYLHLWDAQTFKQVKKVTFRVVMGQVI